MSGGERHGLIHGAGAVPELHQCPADLGRFAYLPRLCSGNQTYTYLLPLTRRQRSEEILWQPNGVFNMRIEFLIGNIVELENHVTRPQRFQHSSFVRRYDNCGIVRQTLMLAH
jgi:hypothetical protein